ncbi:hypothetical protein LPJ59_005129, partial [Coemansia sp. RSA 2399]
EARKPCSLWGHPDFDIALVALLVLLRILGSGVEWINVVLDLYLAQKRLRIWIVAMRQVRLDQADVLLAVARQWSVGMLNEPHDPRQLDAPGHWANLPVSSNNSNFVQADSVLKVPQVLKALVFLRLRETVVMLGQNVQIISSHLGPVRHILVARTYVGGS